MLPDMRCHLLSSTSDSLSHCQQAELTSKLDNVGVEANPGPNLSSACARHCQCPTCQKIAAVPKRARPCHAAADQLPKPHDPDQKAGPPCVTPQCFGRPCCSRRAIGARALASTSANHCSPFMLPALQTLGNKLNMQALSRSAASAPDPSRLVALAKVGAPHPGLEPGQRGRQAAVGLRVADGLVPCFPCAMHSAT